MANLSRPKALKIAAGLSFLLNVMGLIISLPMVAQGAAASDQNPNAIPYMVSLIGALTAVAALIGVYGTWKQQRWGIVLTIIANLVNGLSAAPGILFAPQPGLFVAAISTVIISILIIVLCLWRERQPVSA
jgi:hypothetical protein